MGVEVGLVLRSDLSIVSYGHDEYLRFSKVESILDVINHKF